MVAAVPLNSTESDEIVELNPVPEIVTVAPTGPCIGLHLMMEICVYEYLVIERRLPTAS
jgi:hypothetical protein